MAMAVGGPAGTIANINMTPMIDVLLVLIIIFMVITPLTPKGLEAATGRDFQDSRRTRDIRQGRSRPRIPIRRQSNRHRARRGH